MKKGSKSGDSGEMEGSGATVSTVASRCKIQEL